VARLHRPVATGVACREGAPYGTASPVLVRGRRVGRPPIARDRPPVKSRHAAARCASSRSRFSIRPNEGARLVGSARVVPVCGASTGGCPERLSGEPSLPRLRHHDADTACRAFERNEVGDDGAPAIRGAFLCELAARFSTFGRAKECPGPAACPRSAWSLHFRHVRFSSSSYGTALSGKWCRRHAEVHRNDGTARSVRVLRDGEHRPFTHGFRRSGYRPQRPPTRHGGAGTTRGNRCGEGSPAFLRQDGKWAEGFLSFGGWSAGSVRSGRHRTPPRPTSCAREGRPCRPLGHAVHALPATGVDPKTVRRECPPDHPEIREAMKQIAGKRRRSGCRRIGVLLERERMSMTGAIRVAMRREAAPPETSRIGRARGRSATGAIRPDVSHRPG